jgi:hypothetical protein
MRRANEAANYGGEAPKHHERGHIKPTVERQNHAIQQDIRGLC